MVGGRHPRGAEVKVGGVLGRVEVAAAEPTPRDALVLAHRAQVAVDVRVTDADVAVGGADGGRLVRAHTAAVGADGGQRAAR